MINKSATVVKETDLYAPVKSMLEAKGYEVKAEIKGCDVVAVKDDAPVVIVELKLAFSIDLVLQGINRQSISNDVYLAVPAPNTSAKRKNWRARQRDYIKLCRLLGLGLMLVVMGTEKNQRTKILLDPGPYLPRKKKKQQTRLLTEFRMRVGDPNTGGVNRSKIITAYRQNALRCALVLAEDETMKVADIRSKANVANAASILQKNHYAWFVRVGHGVYCLTPLGREGLLDYAEILPSLIESNK